MTYGRSHTGARVDIEVLQKFDEHFPHLTRQWFISECFKQAVELAENGGEVSAKEATRQAAQDVVSK